MRRRLFLVILFFTLLLNLYVDFTLSTDDYPDATEFLIVTTSLIDIGLLIGLFAFFVHEQRVNRRTQAALRLSLKHLSDMNESLKTAEAERSVFFKKTVHDLKNPLGSIRGFAELLECDDNAPKTIVQMSQTIQRISDGTLAMVNSLMAEGRSTRKAGSGFKKLDLNQCLAETCRYLEPMASEKDQKIELSSPSEPVWILGDGLRIRDVFFNLIGNAIKFSPGGTTTRVFFKANKDMVSVVVKDEGPGLSSNDLSNLFLPGQKLSAKATGGETSSGFGLYSVKETVEAHEGRIEAQNNPDTQGASFIVSFHILRETDQFVKPVAVFCPPKSKAAETFTCGSSEPTI